MVWLSGKKRRSLSLFVSVCMMVQMVLQMMIPFAAQAAETDATSVSVDKKITFKLPKSAFNVKAIVKGVAAPVALNDLDGDGTYTASVGGLTAGGTVEYKFTVNDVSMIKFKEGAVDKEYITGTANSSGTAEMSFTPKVYVMGSFAAWTTNEMKANGSGSGYEFTTPVLKDGLYEYQYVIEQAGTPKLDVYIKDPTNALAGPSNSNLWVGAPILADSFVEQPGAKNTWTVVGDFQGWDIKSNETKFTHLVGGYYVYSRVLSPGTYNFKFAKNNAWDGAVGKGADNFVLKLSETQKVNFYVNEDLPAPFVRTSAASVPGLPQYTPILSQNKWPRLIGDFQQALFPGEANNDPSKAGQYLIDYNFDGTIYKILRSMPVGKFNAKVAFGADTSEVYGATGLNGTAATLNVLDPSPVTFTLDYSVGSSKKLTHDYKPSDSLFDGKIKSDRIVYDSRSTVYKQPYGAIPAGTQDLTLRIAADKDDVQIAKVELSDGDKAYSYDMSKAATVPDSTPVAGTSGARDLFEVTIPKAKLNKIAVWSYKFILVDGSTKVEYGDDVTRGGIGAVADEGALPYDVTIYNPTFKTPDWMKGAIVYQIFPDRFFDGTKDNNRAKVADGYRGERTGPASNPTITKFPLQFFDGGVPNEPTLDQVAGKWSDVPENPNRITPENKPYFPDAKSDKIWGNEFYGGDIQGIGQKLDYLKSLGVSVLYLNPVAWAGSNHKYDATDYSHLDPMFGQPIYNVPGDPKSGLNYAKTREASDKVFEDFAKQARAKGFKIFVDGVFNHVGDDSIYFDRYEKYPEIGSYEYWAKVWGKVDLGKTKDAAEAEVRTEYTSKTNPATGTNYQYPADFKYVNMFTVQQEKTKWGYHKYDAWWGFDSLPAMDTIAKKDNDPLDISGTNEYNNVPYRNLIIGQDLTGKSSSTQNQLMQDTVSQRWNWMGARGWRLDVAPEVSTGTWTKFRQAVKSTAGLKDANGETIDEPLLLAEEWGVASNYLLGDTFDSVMNYRFRRAVQGFMMDDTFSGNRLNDELESIREDYPAQAWNVMLNLVSSHDVPRNITKLDYPKYEDETVKIAPAASDRALKLQGLTAIFQMGYPGAPTIYYGDEVGLEGTRDPDSRRSFPWNERIIESNGTFQATSKYQELFNTYRSASNVRANNDLFQVGDLKMAYADANVLAYARKDTRPGGKGGLVVINKSPLSQTISADVSGFLPDGIVLKDKLFGFGGAVVTNGKVNVSIPAYSGYMMISEQAIPSLSVVSDVQATATGDKVTVSWSPVSGAEKYNVWRSLIPGGDLTKVGTIASSNVSSKPSFTDSGLSYGTKYYFTVTAANSASESVPATPVSATPAYVFESLTVGDVQPITVGVGNQAQEINVTIEASGLDATAYVGKSFPNAMLKMGYFQMNADYSFDQLAEVRKNAAFTKLRYRKDGTPSADGRVAKVYAATLEPFAAGTFHLFGQSQLGEVIVKSAEKPLTVNASTDIIPPTIPITWLKDLNVESNKVRLQWTTLTNDDIAGIEIWRRKIGNVSEPAELLDQRIAVVDAKATDFTDYMVSNDVKYAYKIAAIDSSYNRSISAEKQVTPKLIMVEVTVRAHIPAYTPETDDLFIAGNANNWNASGWKLSIPNGKSGRDVLEYSFKMMAGKEIEYKFTRGTWDTEAFTSHTRTENDTLDPGNWFYSDVNTNMKLKVENQANGKMLVDDYIIGYRDMPMIVSMPRKYFGGNNDSIDVSTEDKTFALKAKVPFGVDFQVNGKSIAADQMDEFGNVYVPEIKLSQPKSIFTLHIEPTEATKKQSWFKDASRAQQATKSITLTVTNPNFPSFANPIKVISTSDSAVKLTWSRPDSKSALISYSVYLGKTKLATLPATATSYEVSGLRSGVENEYRLEVTNDQQFTTSTATLFTIPVKTDPVVTATPKPGTTTGPGQNTPQTTRVPVTTPAGPIEEPDLPIILSPISIDEKIDRNNVKKYMVNVDEQELNDAFAEQKSRTEQKVVVTLEGEDPRMQQAANLVVPASLIRNVIATYRKPVLGLYTDTTRLEVPLRALDLIARAESIGVNVNDLSVVFSVQRATETITRQVKAKVAAQNGTLLTIPIDFKVGLMYGDRIFAIDQLGDSLVQRTIIYSKALKSSKVTGATIDALTGDLIFAPALFKTEGIRTAVTMLHPVNGLYFVAQLNKAFDDTVGHWAKSDIMYMSNKLIATELADGQFRPDQAISREQFAVMLVRGLGLPTVNTSDKFMDLSPNDKYSTYCYAAEAYALMNGVDGNMFLPDKTITRQEMAVMLSRALELAGRPNEAGSSSNRMVLSSFGDRLYISTWAQSAVAHVVSTGVMKGVTSKQFQPKAKVSRAQATSILRRLLTTINYLQ